MNVLGPVAEAVRASTVNVACDRQRVERVWLSEALHFVEISRLAVIHLDLVTDDL